MTSVGFWQTLRQSPLQTIHHWQSQRLSWLFFFISAFLLELCALGFQYIMLLDPCELCVYQRLAILLLMAAPLLMIISPSNIPLRILGYGVWVSAALYGLNKAIIQMNGYDTVDFFNATCSFRPSFPLDLPLYEWLPSLFMPTGLCGADDWHFLTLNMAQWMVIIFGIYLVAAVLCIISSLFCWANKKSTS